MEISRFWQLIQKHLQPNMKIKNWTAYNNYLDTYTDIKNVSQDKIVVSQQNKKKDISIFKEDFEYVLSIWDAYCSGRVKRSEMKEKSFKLTYLLAIAKYIFQYDQ